MQPRLGSPWTQKNSGKPRAAAVFPLHIAAAHSSLQCKALSAGVSVQDNAMKSRELDSQSSAPPAARRIAALSLFRSEIGRASGEELSQPWMA